MRRQGIDSVAAALVRLYFDDPGGEAAAAAALEAVTRVHLSGLLGRDSERQTQGGRPA